MSNHATVECIDLNRELQDGAHINKPDINFPLHMPTDFLRRVGNPTEFEVSFEDGKFILVPQTGGLIDSMRVKKVRTCRVSSGVFPFGKFICPNCGSTA